MVKYLSFSSIKCRMRCAISIFLFMTLCCIAMSPQDIYAAQQKNIIYSSDTSITFMKNNTYNVKRHVRFTFVTAIAAKSFTSYSMEYFPKTQKISDVIAKIISASGVMKKIPKNRFVIQDSSASRDAPGFVSSKTLTILLPTLKSGDSFDLAYNTRWRYLNKNIFSYNIYPNSMAFTKYIKVDIHDPYHLGYGFYASPSFKVAKSGSHRIARLDSFKQVVAEASMVRSQNYSPVVVVASAKNWHQLGNFYAEKYQNLLQQSQRADILAKKLVGVHHGLAAAKILYHWEVSHLHYVAIYLNTSNLMIPNPPDQVLKNGYGDCKDFSILLSAMCRAVGVKAYPAFVNWGNSYARDPMLAVSQNNHFIVYLSQYHLFLNPTNESTGFAVLSTILSDKLALVFTSPVQLILTQKNTPGEKNSLRSASNISISDGGSISGSNQTTYVGSIATLERNGFNNISSKKKFIQQLLAADFYGGTGTMAWMGLNDSLQPVVIKSAWSSKHVLKMAKQLYIKIPIGLGFHHSYFTNLLTISQRLYGLVLGRKSIHLMTKVSIPHDYQINHTPPGIHIDNPVIKIDVTYTYHNHILQKSSVIVFKKIVVPASLYHYFRSAIYTLLLGQRQFLEMTKVIST